MEKWGTTLQPVTGDHATSESARCFETRTSVFPPGIFSKCKLFIIRRIGKILINTFTFRHENLIIVLNRQSPAIIDETSYSPNVKHVKHSNCFDNESNASSLSKEFKFSFPLKFRKEKRRTQLNCVDVNASFEMYLPDRSLNYYFTVITRLNRS